MRRLHKTYDDDDMYDDYDDYDDDYDEDEEEAAAAAIMAEYVAENRQPALAAPPAAPAPARPAQQAKPAPKPATSSAADKEAQAELLAKVLQISEMLPNVGNERIKEALRAEGGVVDAAVNRILSLQDSEPAAPSPARPAGKAVVLDLGGFGTSKSTNDRAVSSDEIGKPSSAKNDGAVANAVSLPKASKTSAKPRPSGSSTSLALDAGKAKRGPKDAEAEKAEIARVAAELKALGLADEDQAKPNVNLVVVGHVDAGKSTLMGHLLYKLKFVTQRQMHKFEKEAKEVGKGSFAFAWVLDEHEDERKRGVTVEVGVKYFETANRTVTLLDAPGHRDFIPNMITGAAQGDVAILVVPGDPGEFESSFAHNGQTKEHAVLVRYCGIRRLVVAINKMDVCDWSQARFDEVTGELLQFLTQQGYAEEDLLFVPVSGLVGDNLVERLRPGVADWYKGPSLLETIDSMPPVRRPAHKPLRMVVVDVFKTILLGAHTVSGKIEAGVIREGQQVIIAPGNHPAKVKAIQRHRGKEVESAKIAKAGENVDIGLVGLEDTMIDSSSIVCDPNNPMPIVSRFTAEIATFQALAVPLLNGTQVTLHLQSFHVPATITKLISVEQGEGKPAKLKPRFVRRNQTATVEITTSATICVERFDDYRPLSRVLLRQNGVTVAAGRVTGL
mmetsp:Transcript_8496/g.27013  ORF Transcript_8496/g.27013 Transcript_8496/m.27013 type:complete len:672 (-) Transcript_8496:71-2086(-)